jgi:hypothetical protein
MLTITYCGIEQKKCLTARLSNARAMHRKTGPYPFWLADLLSNSLRQAFDGLGDIGDARCRHCSASKILHPYAPILETGYTASTTVGEQVEGRHRSGSGASSRAADTPANSVSEGLPIVSVPRWTMSFVCFIMPRARTGNVI